MKRSHQWPNYLQSLSLDRNSNVKSRNGSSHKGLLSAVKRYKSTLAALMTNPTEFIESSSNLFPHLVHIFELTKDFIHRASGVIDIPNEWADLDVAFVKTKVVALRSPEKYRRPIEKFINDLKTWPFIPNIFVCEEEKQLKIKNKILFMNEQKYKETKQVLEAEYLDNKAIRAAITQPGVREVHEALTELFETPIRELLLKIKQNMQKSNASDKQDKLSIELDILLNTVMHPSSVTIKSVSSTRQTISEIPDELRNYLLRKRDVSGFGIWNNNEFRVFASQENSIRHLQENLLKNFAQFFTSYQLNVIVCKPCFRQFYKQGDKIYPNRSTPLEPNEENGYGTLGGFVTDQNADIHALTCAHVCQQGSSVFVTDGVSSREQIGECVFKTNLQAKTITKFIDVALVKIDKRVKDRCDRSMYNDERLPSQIRIYSGSLHKMEKKAFVYKIGASTSVTRGLVTSSEYHCKVTEGRAELFFISGVGDDPFAKDGDSGSIVFTVENSSARDMINIVGMVSGGFTQNACVTDQGNAKKATDGKNSTKEKKDDEELGRKNEDSNQECIVCFRMDTALEFLKQNGWDIRFEDQI